MITIFILYLIVICFKRVNINFVNISSKQGTPKNSVGSKLDAKRNQRKNSNVVLGKSLTVGFSFIGRQWLHITDSSEGQMFLDRWRGKILNQFLLRFDCRCWTVAWHLRDSFAFDHPPFHKSQIEREREKRESQTRWLVKTSTPFQSFSQMKH